MKKSEIVRAWKDARFRASLDDTMRAAMVSSPVGAMGLREDRLKRAAGTRRLTTAWFCTLSTTSPACGD